MGRAIASILRGGDVVELQGELGAGKTTLVRAMAQALGADERLVSSPTFVIVNEYPCARRNADSSAASPPPSDHINRIAHVDAYRLGGTDDLEALGWDRFALHDGHARDGWLLLVEWGERIADALPRDRAVLRLRHAGRENERTIEIELPESWRERTGVRELLEREPIQCRISGRWVSPTSPTYPFAGERERMADLGRWFSGGYVASREITEDDVQ